MYLSIMLSLGHGALPYGDQLKYLILFFSHPFDLCLFFLLSPLPVRPNE